MLRKDLIELLRNGSMDLVDIARGIWRYRRKMRRMISGILSRVLSMPMIAWSLHPHTAVSVISNLIKINYTSPASVLNVMVRGYRDLCLISKKKPEWSWNFLNLANRLYVTKKGLDPFPFLTVTLIMNRRIKC